MSIQAKVIDAVINKVESKVGNPTVGTHNEQVRVNWIEQTLRKIPSGSRILDAGAGEQVFKKFCNHLVYVSQDFAQYEPEVSTVGLQMHTWDYGQLDIVSDINSIPEPDSSFDAIMCTEVFEHIPEPIVAIKEFARLLKKDGYLIITAPFCSLTHFAPHHYYTGFNKYFYQKHLSDYDFDILEISANGNFFEYAAQEIRRVPFMANRYAGGTVSHWEELAIKIVLKMLDRFSSKDTNSAELLNFGCHVLARKR